MAANDSLFDVFLSYNGSDVSLAERLFKELHTRDLKVFFAPWHLVPGLPWLDKVDDRVLTQCKSVAVVLGPSGLGPLQKREHFLALARQRLNDTFPVIPVLCPGSDPPLAFVGENTWIDLRGGLDDPLRLDILAAAIRGQAPASLLESSRRIVADICPYRGLESFRAEDAGYFFGRQVFVDRLMEAITRQPLVVVAGASGSGKSSVVRAGLLPALDAHRHGEPTVVTIVPGDRPIHALSSSLLALLEPQMTETDKLAESRKLAGHLTDGTIALRDLVDQCLIKQGAGSSLFLVVDQWEELYTLATEAEANRFIDILLGTLEKAPLTLLLILRADFYGRTVEHRGLAARLDRALISLGAMEPDELAEVISGPAKKAGLELQPGLEERLLADVGNEPGNLALLEFTLKELWSARQGTQLLHSVYSAMGGIRGAIAKTAESFFAQLDKRNQGLAQGVFTRLVRPGFGTGDSRRRAFLAEFDEAETALVRSLAGNKVRLLVLGRDASTGQATVEVPHEALLREWGRLREWTNQKRRQIEDRALLEDMAQNWLHHGKSRWSGLVSAGRLRGFMALGVASSLERSYLRASLRLALVELAFVAFLLAGMGQYLWWSDNSGLGVAKTAQLILYRAGLYQPSWIPTVVEIRPGERIPQSTASFPRQYLPDSDSAPRPVTLNAPFGIGKTQVTFDQYCASTRRPCPNDNGWGRGSRPVINVSWADATDYARWLSGITGRKFRLPSAIERDYAASAPGQKWSAGAHRANCFGCDGQWSGYRTSPVASFDPNPWGLYDTSGNVWEWLQDCDPYSSAEGWRGEEAAGNKGSCLWRLQGGSAWDTRPGAQRGSASTESANNVGFRLACALRDT